MASNIEKFNAFEQVSQLYLKGYNYTEIGTKLDLTPAMVRGYVNEYKQFLQDRTQADPHLLDRLQENTLELLDEVAMLAKEAWQIFEKSKEFDMINHQLSSLKVASELTDKKAKLLQLMGAKTDSGAMARMQKAEKVNAIVSQIIKETISGCDRCRSEAQYKLAEAFELMDQAEEATSPTPMES